MRQARPSLSLIVPAYDESRRIGGPLKEMSDYLAAQPYTAEIVVVDDGSRDGTFELVQEVARSLAVPVRLIGCARNRGKGHALKVGFLKAAGERLLFTDADLATPIQETARLLATLDRGADIAIGSRKTAGARVEVHQPWYREQMGKVFTWIVRRLIADVSDATCGFKAFRAEVGRDLFSRMRIDDWSFDAELLWLAHWRGYALEEVPVTWADQTGTRVRLLRDTVGAFLGLLRIRWNALRGRYRQPLPLDAELREWGHPGCGPLPPA